MAPFHIFIVKKVHYLTIDYFQLFPRNILECHITGTKIGKSRIPERFNEFNSYAMLNQLFELRDIESNAMLKSTKHPTISLMTIFIDRDNS